MSSPISHIRLKLKAELARRVLRNPAYSLRAFARDMATSPAHMSEFLKGAATLSRKKLVGIYANLGWDLSELAFRADEAAKPLLTADTIRVCGGHLEFATEPDLAQPGSEGQRQQVVVCSVRPADLTAIMAQFSSALQMAVGASREGADDAKTVLISWHMFHLDGARPE